MSGDAHDAERLLRARRRIHELEHLNAFISLSGEEPAPGPIVAVKDLIWVRGMPVTGGASLEGREPVETDAPLIVRLRQAGGMVIGKTNLYEWGFGVNGHNPHHGDIANPHDTTRTAGGSSGGSAVAVATGMCDWAIGTDTGGSIRIPASLCGVVGFKPTRDLVNPRKVIPLSPRLDTIGPLAPDVRSAARALEILSGIPVPVSRHRPPRLAVPRGWVNPGELDAATRATWSSVSRSLPEVELPDRALISSYARTVLEWEALAHHERTLEDHPERFGAEMRNRLKGVIAGKAEDFASPYAEALMELSYLSEQVEDALEGLDAIVLPATACVAPPLTERAVGEPLTRYARAFNYTGHPAIVIPGPSDSLPVGIQLVGQLGRESRLASAALFLEDAWAHD
jgi:aspartyl-tRNA(Asn)/glutamyl-tRNA(Gln) amidotransferase subunit A